VTASNQAILPLKGCKILTSKKRRDDKMLRAARRNQRSSITALGTGLGQRYFDAGKCELPQIILIDRRGVDGSHIRTLLLLTFSSRHMKELIDSRHIYIAQPPPSTASRRGQTEKYIRR